MIRILLVMAGIAYGALLASLAPGPIESMRAHVAALPGMAWFASEAAKAGAEPHAEGHGHHHAEGAIELSDQQIAAAAIEVGQAQASILSRRRFVPGTIVPSGDLGALVGREGQESEL